MKTISQKRLVCAIDILIALDLWGTEYLSNWNKPQIQDLPSIEDNLTKIFEMLEKQNIY